MKSPDDTNAGSLEFSLPLSCPPTTGPMMNPNPAAVLINPMFFALMMVMNTEHFMRVNSFN